MVAPGDGWGYAEPNPAERGERWELGFLGVELLRSWEWELGVGSWELELIPIQQGCGAGAKLRREE
jgi:hypothetical protein